MSGYTITIEGEGKYIKIECLFYKKEENISTNRHQEKEKTKYIFNSLIVFSRSYQIQKSPLRAAGASEPLARSVPEGC